MAIFGWPYFFWGRLITRNWIAPAPLSVFSWIQKSGKKKYKRKRLPRQPLSITANAITRLLSALPRSW
jgi:hypothetical protein